MGHTSGSRPPLHAPVEEAGGLFPAALRGRCGEGKYGVKVWDRQVGTALRSCVPRCPSFSLCFISTADPVHLAPSHPSPPHPLPHRQGNTPPPASFINTVPHHHCCPHPPSPLPSPLLPLLTPCRTGKTLPLPQCPFTWQRFNFTAAPGHLPPSPPPSPPHPSNQLHATGKTLPLPQCPFT